MKKKAIALSVTALTFLQALSAYPVYKWYIAFMGIPHTSMWIMVPIMVGAIYIFAWGVFSIKLMTEAFDN